MIDAKALSIAESKLIDLGITSPTEIDLEAIAWDEGVVVKYERLTGCEARLVGYKDRAIITIQKNSDIHRKRFSIAHELGHWTYHRGRSFRCRVDDMVEAYESKPHEEKEADTYASELLMPEYLFRPIARTIRRPDFDSIQHLANDFNTSLTATAIRLVKLNVFPLLLVCHGQRGRKWFVRSKDVPERWFPQHELSADSIAFDRLFGGETRVRAQKIGAETWFDRRDAERYDIVEDAIHVSKGQVLTLLWIENPEMLKDEVN